MFGLERLHAIPTILVRDYKRTRCTLELAIEPKGDELYGIPVANIPNKEIYLPGKSQQSQAFLAKFSSDLTSALSDEINVGSFELFQSERLFLGEVAYETQNNQLKIISINELKGDDKPADVKADETLLSGKLPFTVSYVIPGDGEPYVEIYILTLHPEVRVKLGELIKQKIEDSLK